MLIRSLCALLVCSLALPFLALAAPPGRALSLEQALELAVRNNQTVEIARLEVLRADEDVSEAYSYALPSVDVTAGYNHNIKQPVFLFPGENGEQQYITIGLKNSFSANVTLTQALFNYAVLTGVGTANVYANVSREALRSTIVHEAFNTRLAYLQALLAQENVRLYEASKESISENMRRVNILFEEGLVSEYDALTLQLLFESADNDVLAARDEQTAAIANLKQTIGAQADEQFELTDALSVPQMPQATSLGELQSKAIELNYDLATLRLQRQVTDELLEVERADYVPSLSAIAQYSLQGQSDDLDFGAITDAKTAMVGVQLNWNLFRGNRTATKMEKARIDKQKVDQQINLVETQIRNNVETAFLQLQTSLKRVEVAERSVERAERGYEIAQTRYDNGIGSQLELKDAETTRVQSGLAYAAAVFQAQVARATLDMLTGELNPSLFEIHNDVLTRN